MEALSVANWPKLWGGSEVKCTYSRLLILYCLLRSISSAEHCSHLWKKEGVVVHTGDRVERIEDGRTIISQSGSYECHKILVALGDSPIPRAWSFCLGVKCDEVGHPLIDSKLRTTIKKYMR